MKQHKWWLVVEGIEDADKSGLINYGLAGKYKNYASLKRVVWKWYKQHLGRKDIKTREKLILYALCERYSAQDFSSHDAVTYLALMIGMHRHTVSKGIQKLMDLNILWCAIDVLGGNLFSSH